MKIVVTIANDIHGEEIRALQVWAGYDHMEKLDWSRLGPNWLIAISQHGQPQLDDVVVGCLQVLPGLPVGRLELLAVHPELHDVERAQVVRALAYQGMGTLKLHGSQAASFLIPHELRSYKKVLRKRGAVVVASGNMMLKMLVRFDERMAA